MEKKPKVTATDTFVFDDADIEAFDELSMTALLGEVTDSSRGPPRAQAADEKRRPGEAPKESDENVDFEFDPEIAALMNELDEKK